MALPTIGIRSFTRLAYTSLVGLGLLIVSGGLVRLTDSGLGCPDWPSCARTTFVGALSFHKEVEFGNRVLSGLITALVVVTVLAALRLRPARRDVTVPAVVLAAGVLAQIPMGGLVVISHLWPPFVMAHFLLSASLVAVATVLCLRAREPAGTARAMVPARLVGLSRLVVGATALLLALGTAVSAAGPHGGARGARRLPVPFRGVTELHATVAAFVLGLVLATLFATWIAGSPREVLHRARLLLAALVAQAGIGYSQYFLKVPAGLVALHLAGATLVLVAAISFHLGLFSRLPAAPGEVPTKEFASPGGADRAVPAPIPAAAKGVPAHHGAEAQSLA